MGQKVSPIGMRVGVIRDWDSKWFSEKEYGTLLQEDVKIRKYIQKEFAKAQVSHVEIERKAKEVNIVIKSVLPGELIGENGTKADQMKKAIVKMCGGKEVKINVVQIENPDLDAHVVARQIADQLEARASFRSAQKKAIQKTMRAGAKGIKTSIGGRLGGADIARSEGYSEGVVPLHTIRADIDFATANAMTTYGILGVKVWICRGEVLKGEMVKDPEAPKFNAPRKDFKKNNRGERPARKDVEKAPVEEKEVTENVAA